MRGYLIIFLFGFYASSAIAQFNHKADSLKQIIASSGNDSIILDAYEGFYDVFINSHPDSVKHYLRQGMSFAREIGNLSNHAYFATFVAYVDYQQGDFERAHLTLDSALKFVQDKPRYLSSELKLLNWKGVVFQGERKMDSAYAVLSRIVELSDDFPQEQLRAYLILGNISLRKLEFQKALHLYHKVDSVCRANQFEGNACISAVANSGMILSEIGQLDNSLKYLEEAYQSHLSSGDTIPALSLTDDIARVHFKQGNYLLAENLLVESTAILKEQNYPRYEVQGLKVLNKVYREQSAFEKALSILNRAKELSEQMEDTVSIAEIYIDYGKYYSEIGDFDKADSLADEILYLLDESHQIQLLDASYQLEYRISVFDIMVAIREGMQDYKGALELNSELQSWKDSLDAIKDKRNIAELEAEYQSEKKEQEIKLLTSQSQLAAQRTKNQRNVFIAGISVLGLAFITLFVLFKNKQRTNQRLMELESAKSKLFANISHEFRTPLTLISGPVAHQLSKDNLSPEDKTDLGLIQRNACRLLDLVNQMLDISKIEAGRRNLRISNGNLELFLKHLVEPFAYQASQKGMVFHNDIHVPGEHWFDRDIVEKVVSNLLSNALKYNLEEGEIKFEALLKNGAVEIRVGNENSEVSEKELPQLFNRFYQANAFNQGFGIGLSLASELVILSRGTIEAFKPDAGTIVFSVTLPVSKNSFSRDDLVPEGAAKDIQRSGEPGVFGPDIESGEIEDSTLPVLLVVDDNDEIRLFIKSLFSKEYQILEAKNGEEGVTVALKAIPDLIISDIMMPVQDGIHLTNTLKSDERTSHIPVVLLTAKSGEENELTGLKAGADAYMVKPFKEEKLRVIIKKLIAIRETIREKLNKHILLKPKAIELGRADTELLDRIGKILEERLTDPEFSAQSFSEEVGLSRMHLHRKLKALTGYSTSEFIRLQRLKYAAKFLREGHENISEVGYAVGFNQPAYFSTAFKQHFGCSPSEYAKT